MQSLVRTGGFAWSASAAVSIWLGAGVAAFGQAGAEVSYTAMIVELCRQYAAAVTGMPADLMFDQCVLQRHCRASSGSSGYQCEMPGPMTWLGGGY